MGGYNPYLLWEQIDYGGLTLFMGGFKYYMSKGQADLCNSKCVN